MIVCLDQEYRIQHKEGWSCQRGLASFDAKVMPSLNRVDPSFKLSCWILLVKPRGSNMISKCKIGLACTLAIIRLDIAKALYHKVFSRPQLIMYPGKLECLSPSITSTFVQYYGQGLEPTLCVEFSEPNLFSAHSFTLTKDLEGPLSQFLFTSIIHYVPNKLECLSL